MTVRMSRHRIAIMHKMYEYMGISEIAICVLLYAINSFVPVSQPVRGYFVLDLASLGGATDRLTISYDFRQMAPKLIHSPTRVAATLLRGKQYTFQVRTVMSL